MTDERFIHFVGDNKDTIFFTYNKILKAYEDCAKTKRTTYSAISFTRNLLSSIMCLCDEINNGTYEIGKSITFVVKYPVYREVFAADFRDRIIHHLIMNELLSYFEKEFIYDSYSCREGKGVKFGVERVIQQIEECSENYTKDAWVLKLDIKSFFMSINKELLARMVDEFIVEKYPDNRKKGCLRWLCEKVILHHPENNCERRGDLKAWDKLPKGKSLFDVGATHGLPIGNLTSQVFANFFMDKLDKYIKNELGFNYYGRYVDDFVIISDDKEKLKKAVPLIEKFLKEKLQLTLHPRKRYMQHVSKGLSFIGTKIKPHRKYTLNRTIGTLYYKMTHEFKEPSFDKLERLVMVVNSYLGFMIHNNSYNIRKDIFNKWGVFDGWLQWIEVAKDYSKIAIKKEFKDKKNNIENMFTNHLSLKFENEGDNH